MKYCKNCGKELADEAVICPNCGVPQEELKPNDSGSIGWSLLGCCLPIVGLVLWIVWRNTKPKSAKKACIGTVVGSIIFAICYAILAIMGFAIGASGLH